MSRAAAAKATPHAQSPAGVLNGKAVPGPPPYPAIARSAHASGQLVVQVLIDENGNVVPRTQLRSTRCCKLRP